MEYPIERVGGTKKPRTRQIGDVSGRIPPQATGIEQSILGAMMIGGTEALAAAAETLPARALYSAKHQKIYSACLHLFEHEVPVDLITLSEELKRRGELDDVGGQFYLTELTTQVASTANVEYHARTVLEKYLMRRLIEHTTSITAQAYDPSSDAFEVLEEAETGCRDLLGGVIGSGNAVTGPELARLAVAPFNLVPTTYPSLDRKLSVGGDRGGLPAGRVTLIAARPSHGKTSFGLDMALRFAHAGMGRVMYFSCEMSAQMVSRRLASNLGSESPLSDLPLTIDDTANPTTRYMMARSIAAQGRESLAAIFFDYLEYTGEGPAGQTERLNNALNGCHAIARRLDCPVIVLHQLNRKIENRAGLSEPQLADLRETGEQQSAMVMMLQCPFVQWYQQGSKGDRPSDNILRVFIRKNTYGPLCSVTLGFNRETGRIWDPTESNVLPDHAGDGAPSRYEPVF